MRLEGGRFLVTGAGGFIGSHLADSLIRQGAGVRAFVRYTSTGTVGLLEHLTTEVTDQVEIVWGDLQDTDAVRRAVDGCDGVFHLGALIAIPYSYVHPMEFVQVNVVGTANVACACRDLDVERLVHISTSEVYGTAQFVPITEEHPLQGQSPYSASKIGADQIVGSFVRCFDLPAVIVRPFNTYGPRQSTRAIIPTIISQALKGHDLRLGSLTPTRDFTFVTDTVAGMICAMKKDGHHGSVFNLGSGREISIGKLAETIIGLTGGGLRIERDVNRVRPPASEVGRLCADCSMACTRLGWEPEVPLSKGLELCIDYYRGLGIADADNYHI